MEIKEKVIKVYTLDLTEEEVLDLRSILKYHLEDYALNPEQEALVKKLKREVEGI